jgi:hypothetical protein
MALGPGGVEVTVIAVLQTGGGQSAGRLFQLMPVLERKLFQLLPGLESLRPGG